MYAFIGIIYIWVSELRNWASEKCKNMENSIILKNCKQKYANITILILCSAMIYTKQSSGTSLSFLNQNGKDVSFLFYTWEMWTVDSLKVLQWWNGSLPRFKPTFVLFTVISFSFWTSKTEIITKCGNQIHVSAILNFLYLFYVQTA